MKLSAYLALVLVVSLFYLHELRVIPDLLVFGLTLIIFSLSLLFFRPPSTVGSPWSNQIFFLFGIGLLFGGLEYLSEYLGISSMADFFTIAYIFIGVVVLLLPLYNIIRAHLEKRVYPPLILVRIESPGRIGSFASLLGGIVICIDSVIVGLSGGAVFPLEFFIGTMVIVGSVLLHRGRRGAGALVVIFSGTALPLTYVGGIFGILGGTLWLFRKSPSMVGG